MTSNRDSQLDGGEDFKLPDPKTMSHFGTVHKRREEAEKRISEILDRLPDNDEPLSGMALALRGLPRIPRNGSKISDLLKPKSFLPDTSPEAFEGHQIPILGRNHPPTQPSSSTIKEEVHELIEKFRLGTRPAPLENSCSKLPSGHRKRRLSQSQSTTHSPDDSSQPNQPESSKIPIKIRHVHMG